MWRWTSCIYILVLYQYSIQQPLTNDSKHARHARQLVAGECCPCPDSSQSGFDQTSGASSRQSMFDTAQDVDDCPCRHRPSDSEGASSILFPNAMRAAGTFLQPADKKEDIKPLLHPEVDLASSVLETLREATNEEYREALARDAVRDAVKISGLSDSTFRDAAPEESRSIVTIIMHPTEEFEGDVTPPASHLQESRCIHAPLTSARSSRGELNVAPKPHLTNNIFRIAKPGLLHRNFMDMDSNVDASNTQEHVVNVNEGLMSSGDGRLRTHHPLLKLNPKSRSSINNDDDFNIMNSNLKSPLISSISNYPLGPSLFQNIKDKKNGPLTIVPKTRLENSLLGNKYNGMAKNDLSIPNNIKEKDLDSGNTIIKEILSIRKPTLKNILENTRPLNLKHLLKLKDVEFIPSDSFNKPTAVGHPTLISPKLNHKYNTVLKSQHTKNQADLLSNSENTFSNSNMIPPYENCSMETEENKTRNVLKVNNNIELDALDSIPNPSNTVFIDNNAQTSGDDCETYEAPIANSNKLIVPMPICKDESKLHESNNDREIEENGSKSIITRENPELDVLGKECETDEKNTSVKFDDPGSGSKSDVKDSSENTSDNDNNSTPGCTNNDEDNLGPKEKQESTEEMDIVSQESSMREHIGNKEVDVVETTTTKYKILKPLSLDKGLLSIKEKIHNTLDNLKNINTDIQGISEQNKSNARISSNDEDPTHISDINVKTDSDCAAEKSEQFITPIISDNDIEKENTNSNPVTLQELQKISDAMLQEELKSDTKNAECVEKIKASEDRSTEKNIENNEVKSESNDSKIQNADVILPKIQNDDSNSDNMVNLCQSELVMNIPSQNVYPETTDRDKADVAEMDAGASDIVINKLSQNIMPLKKNLEYKLAVDNIQQVPILDNDPLSVFKTPLPDVRDILQLAPLPSLDDLKSKLSNLLNTNERDVQEEPSQEEYCIGTSTSELKLDASTANFKVKQPSLKSMNRNIFQSQPQSYLKLPTISTTYGDLGSRLPLFPNDVYATPKVSDIFDDIIEKLPNFDDLKDKMRLNTQELSNTPFLLERFKDKLDISNLKYHTENSLKNIERKLKAVEKDFNLRSPMTKSQSFLDTLAEKHDDLSDKLRAVHMDLNDRLESMRNSLIKPTHNDGKKSNTQLLSNLNGMSKDRQLLLKSRTSPLASNRKETHINTELQRKVKPITSHTIDSRKFKMPAAASMPVPKTVEVPKLKVTPIKSSTPTTKDAPIFKSSIGSTEPPPVRTSTILAKEAIKNLQNANRQLGVNQVNPFKNSRVKVSFSTTSRPLPSLGLIPLVTSTVAPLSKLTPTTRETVTSRNKSNNRPPQKLQDSNGALSETKPLTILTPEANIDNRLRKELDENDIPKDTRNLNLLESWPKITESHFLAKVKEAVSARLPKAKKIGEVEKANNEDNSSVKAALRSASENLDTVRKEPLQENVSYKCRMVCTRE